MYVVDEGESILSNICSRIDNNLIAGRFGLVGLHQQNSFVTILQRSAED